MTVPLSARGLTLRHRLHRPGFSSPPFSSAGCHASREFCASNGQLVLAGAYAYDSGQTDEGKVFAWYDGSGGLGSNGTPANGAWSAEGNQTSARFGLAAGTAGNVNHDQYDDVVIGADKYDNGQTDEGKAFARSACPPGCRRLRCASSTTLAASGLPCGSMVCYTIWWGIILRLRSGQAWAPPAWC
jgi:hypothetical protein